MIFIYSQSLLAGVINKCCGKVTHELLVLLLGFSQVNINLCKKFSSWPFAHKANSLPLYSYTYTKNMYILKVQIYPTPSRQYLNAQPLGCPRGGGGVESLY